MNWTKPLAISFTWTLKICVPHANRKQKQAEKEANGKHV